MNRIARLATVSTLTLLLAGCTNMGTLQVVNGSPSAVADVKLMIQSDGPGQQVSHVGSIAPGESRTVTYAITSEYYLSFDVTDPHGVVSKHYYGYVLDDGRNPTHTVRIEVHNRALVDGTEAVLL